MIRSQTGGAVRGLLHGLALLQASILLEETVVTACCLVLLESDPSDLRRLLDDSSHEYVHLQESSPLCNIWKCSSVLRGSLDLCSDPCGAFP